MQLRPYQVTAIARLMTSLERNPVLASPTGSGKTVMMAAAVQTLNRPTLWLAHRRELVGQAAGQLARLGLHVGVIMAQEHGDPRAPVQVASIDTLRRRQPPPAELIVLDEAHHCRAVTHRELLLGHYAGVPRIGGTATPFRLDGKGLGDLFGSIIVAAYADELISDGTLIEPVVYAPADPDLHDVHKQHGDYNVKELGEAMNRPKLVGDIVEEWKKRCLAAGGLGGKRTVVFAVNIEHSKAIVEAFTHAGIRAEHLDGTTSRTQRDGILLRLKIGYTTVVSNCAVLTEGWDLPALEVAVIARPTDSLCLHLQMLGRIMRSAPEKLGACVLDHAGNHLRHGFVSQRIAYTLEDQPKKAGGESPTKRCPECFLLVPPATQECPGCGYAWESSKAEAPEAVPGELSELLPPEKRPRPPIEEQQRVWNEIEYRRRALGYLAGWSIFQFAARLGFKPLVFMGQIVDPKGAGQDVMAAEFERLEAVRSEKNYKQKWVELQLANRFGPRAWSYCAKRRKEMAPEAPGG